MPRKSPPRDPNLDHPAVKLYIDICRSTPNHVQRAAIVQKIEKLDLWEQILNQFMKEGRPPQRVDWTLERYGNAVKAQLAGLQGQPAVRSEPPASAGGPASPEEEAWMRSRLRAR